MKFPGAADKGRQYEECAYILADAVAYTGYDLSPATRGGWASMMYRLATADALSEADPSIFASGESLVGYLEIAPNEMAVSAAAGLLQASAKSIQADTIEGHLDSRRDEAVQSVALLRSQTPELSDATELWAKVDDMNVAGIYLDSLFDAREDSYVRAAFSAKDLAVNSAARFLKTVRAMDAHTRVAVTRACVEHGLAGHLIRSLPQKALG